MPEFEDALAEARGMAARDDYLLAFDHTEKLRALWPDSVELRHLPVLSLARSGATLKAILRTRHLGSALRQLVVHDGSPADPAVIEGTANDVALWRNLGLETRRIDPGSGAVETFAARPPLPRMKDELGRRSLKAVIFGDVKKFSALPAARDYGVLRMYALTTRHGA